MSSRAFTRIAFCFVLVVAMPTISLAAGFPALEGKMPSEVQISIDVDTALNEAKVSLWKWKRSRESIETIQIYEHEPCVFSEISPTGKYQRKLICEKTAKSPLAGTTYVARSVKGSCKRGDPAFVYTCVSGCTAPSKAPKQLFQDYWEC